MTLQIHANLPELLETNRAINIDSQDNNKITSNNVSYSKKPIQSQWEQMPLQSAQQPAKELAVISDKNVISTSTNNNTRPVIEQGTLVLDSTTTNLLQSSTDSLSKINTEANDMATIIQVNNSFQCQNGNTNPNKINDGNTTTNIICEGVDTSAVQVADINNLTIVQDDHELSPVQTEKTYSVDDVNEDNAGYPISYFNVDYIGSFSLDHEINCLLNFVKDVVTHMEEIRLPWRADFADPDKMRRPKKLSDALTRLNLNVPYYDGNYLEIFYAVTLPFLFFYNIVFLCVLLVICAILHSIALHRRNTGSYGNSVDILGHRISYRKLGNYLLLSIVVLCAFFNGIWTIFYVGLLNAIIIATHGLWRLPTYFDDEDLEKLRPKLIIQLFSFLFIVLSYLEGDVSGPEDEGKRAAEREMQRLGMTQIHFRSSKHWKKWQRKRHSHHKHQPLPGEVQSQQQQQHHRHRHHHHSHHKNHNHKQHHRHHQHEHQQYSPTQRRISLNINGNSSPINNTTIAINNTQ